LGQENPANPLKRKAILDHNFELCFQTENNSNTRNGCCRFLEGRIMKAADRIEDSAMPPKQNDGKDELNLAEFPLCALAHRIRPGQKTVRFEDRVWDESRNETITRQLTITGSDAYGLPTARDDEVLLGLIQLTRLHGFADRKVPFTRHQLLQILGWHDEGKNYARIEASLNRWTGVTLVYERAWWNKARQCWMDEKFHILDNVWLCHNDSPAPDTGLAEDGGTTSAFLWNEVIFRSFQAGNLKGIDFDFFKNLSSAAAKRLYRFLDKRFHFHKRLSFDLKEFAWEHVGLSRGYDAANLKRKLRPGIAELERKGFLQPMSETERFRKLRAGTWQVVFGAARAEVPKSSQSPEAAPADPLVAALTARGLSLGTARTLAGAVPAERIQAQLEVFDWLVARKDPKVARNPPGFLFSAIRSDYQPPADFTNEVAARQRAHDAGERRRAAEQVRVAAEVARAAERVAEERWLEEFWQSLPTEERLRAEAQALQEAPALARSFMEQGGAAGMAARKVALDDYARQALMRSR
jgi:hypothetical protein